MIDIRIFEEYPDLNKPKRPMKYVLIWCTSGNVVVVVDEKELALKKQEVLTITSGQIHYFKSLSKASGAILEFALDFFCKSDADIELIFHNGLFCHFAMNEVIPVKNHHIIETQLQLIQEELTQQPYQYLISIHSRTEMMNLRVTTEVRNGR